LQNVDSLALTLRQPLHAAHATAQQGPMGERRRPDAQVRSRRLKPCFQTHVALSSAVWGSMNCKPGSCSSQPDRNFAKLYHPRHWPRRSRPPGRATRRLAPDYFSVGRSVIDIFNSEIAERLPGGVLHDEAHIGCAPR
jgi:hypothetical protein